MFLLYVVLLYKKLVLTIILTLPLSEEWVFRDPQFFPEICKFSLRKSFSRNVYNLFISRDVLKLYCSFLYSVPDEVISDFNAFGSIMK
jgi:hypothetical protein